MHNFKPITVSRMVVIIAALIAFSTVKTSALNAPYLISAAAINGHSITLTWRNNDFAATKVIVLRKTAGTSLARADSVAATATSYKDSSLQPQTAYSYALLAAAPGVLSDTSNILVATTLIDPGVFVAPRIEVVWVEGQKFITVRYFDSSTTEKGFRLFRKTVTAPWVAIDSVTTKGSINAAWKTFADSTIAENKWYSYKVQVYNDSQTAFSPETTVYNYAPPKKTKTYTFSKKGSIPAKPFSWIERIGDSLYFPEVRAPGDTEITIIDVSNNLAPKFRSYVDPKNIPAWLKGSVVEARVKISSTGIFAHRNGYYIVSRQGTIYRYDSVSLTMRDTIRCGGSWPFLIGWLKDSCCLVGSGRGGNWPFSNYSAQPIHFGPGGIDTFPSSIAWTNFSKSPNTSASKDWGCFNNTAIFIESSNSYSTPTCSYTMYDYTAGYEAPLTFTEKVSERLFGEVLSGKVLSAVFDTSIAFTTTTPGIHYIELYAFNIADAHSGPTSSFLGKLVDTVYSCGNVKEIQVDTKKQTLYLVGDSGISIYAYSVGPVGIHSPAIFRNAASARILTTQNSGGVCFSILGEKIHSLQVLNGKGQIIRSMDISATETFVWNRRDNSGKAAPGGFYIYKIGTLKNGVIAGSMVLVH